MCGDLNCDGSLNVADLVYYANYLWQGGPEPVELAAQLMVARVAGRREQKSVLGAHLVSVHEQQRMPAAGRGNPAASSTVLGDPSRSSFRTILTFDHRMFVTAGTARGDGVLLESRDPACGDNAFQVVSPPRMTREPG